MTYDDSAADGAALGDDGAAIRFTNGDAFGWGDTIEGVVVLAPGAHPVQVAEVAVAVIEQDIDGIVVEPQFLTMGGNPAVSDAMQEVEAPPHNAGGVREVVVARDLTLGTAAPLEVPFTLTVPHGDSLANLYSVAVRVAVATPDADGDREAVEPFVILPPRFLQGLLRGLDGIGEFSVTGVRSEPKADGSGDTYDLDFAPPETLRQHLDGVRFLVEDDATRVWGHLEINPQEHTLAQHLESLVRADRVRFPLEFDKADLAAAGEAGRASEDAARRLQELIGPYIK
jgi:hypothetical protein